MLQDCDFPFLSKTLGSIGSSYGRYHWLLTGDSKTWLSRQNPQPGWETPGADFVDFQFVAAFESQAEDFPPFSRVLCMVKFHSRNCHCQWGKTCRDQMIFGSEPSLCSIRRLGMSSLASWGISKRPKGSQ